MREAQRAAKANPAGRARQGRLGLSARSEVGDQQPETGDRNRPQRNGRASESQDEAQASKEVLERLKRVHDHGGMIARSLKEIEFRREALKMFSKFLCCEMYLHGNFALEVWVRGNGVGIPNPVDRKLLVWPPFLRWNNLLVLNEVSRGKASLDGAHKGVIARDNSVLIGIGEVVDQEKRVVLRGALLERLHRLDLAEPVLNAGQHPWASFGVVPVIVKDRELVSGHEGRVTYLDERGNDVVQRRPEVMNQVSYDDAEARFIEIAREHYERIAFALLVVINSGSVRLSLVDNRLNFTLQGSEVFVRPCDLCLGAAKV